MVGGIFAFRAILKRLMMINVVLGFFIALTVGLTGIGGGSFTVPALLLIVGMPAVEAVGTAFVFAAVLRLIAAPFYVFTGGVHARYLRLLLLGAVPGLVLGMLALRSLSRSAGSPLVVIILGVLLAMSSSVTFIPRAQNAHFALKNSRWLPWFALPIGIESGFSSAGAGALGTVLLLNYSEMTPSEVVGTDILFGLGLAAIGSVIHLKLGSVSSGTLLQLLAAGIPGVLLGFVLARRTPVRKLKSAIALIAILAGMQLVWTGGRSLATAAAAQRAASQASARASQLATTGRAIRPDVKDMRTAGI